MAAKKSGWGGRRAGAGRKPLNGGARRNRVVAFLSDDEHEKLLEYAEEKELPVGTAAYVILTRFLRRRR